MRLNLESLDVFFKSLSTKDVRYVLNRRSDRDSIEVILNARVELSCMEVERFGHKAVVEKLYDLRNIILESKVFDNEREQLKDYEKLKNMEFVLDALKELDLSSIDEQNKEPQYLNIRKMLGGSNG